MIVIDDFRRAFSELAHPGTKHGDKPSVLATLRFYYIIASAPLLLMLVYTYVFPTLILSALGINPGLSSGLSGCMAATCQAINNVVGELNAQNSAQIAAEIAAETVRLLGLEVAVYVLAPLLVLFLAALYQALGGGLFKRFKGGYEGSFAAAMYGVLPYILFGWLTVWAPPFFFILSVWTIVTISSQLSKRQSISILEGFAIYIGAAICGTFILGLLAALAAFIHL